MDLLDYMKLIKYEKDPRNLALWLDLGAGGCRISEALHIFVPHDIGLHPTREKPACVLYFFVILAPKIGHAADG